MIHNVPALVADCCSIHVWEQPHRALSSDGFGRRAHAACECSRSFDGFMEPFSGQNDVQMSTVTIAVCNKVSIP